MTHYLYLSPHLDDAVFSCGALIRDQVDRGDAVTVWTVCAGDPPNGPLSAYAASLHARWGLGADAVARRRAEDQTACARVGAACVHLDLMDCIYRRDPVSLHYIYEGDEAIFGELAAVEAERLAPALAFSWQRKLPADAVLVSPLALGNHVDHQLVRRAAEMLGKPLRYYADLPYVFAWEAMLPGLLPEGAVEEIAAVSAEGLRAWMDGSAAYESQVSTFWGSREEMESAFRAYAAARGGVRWWGVES